MLTWFIIELGIPYSDPIAEGPVIQAANVRALDKGVKIKQVFELVEELRKEVEVPLVFLLYYNCILQYGIEEFLKSCDKAGVDGLIIPDLPFEERDEVLEFSDKYPSVNLITMVTPASNDRITMLASQAKGFLYCVSSLGVTGVRGSFNTDFEEFFRVINKSCNIPTALGFGISEPEQIRSLKDYCDGLIVGSAIVKKVGSSKNPDEAVKSVGEYVHTLREAMDS